MKKKDNLKEMAKTGQRVFGKTKMMVAVLFIMILQLTFTPLSNASECWFGKSKTPWQHLTTVLDKYGVDTVGMNVMSSIPGDILRHIEPDMAKAIGVKMQPDWIGSEMLAGDFLCSFLWEKYKKKSGEKYDYYRVCYSTELGVISNFLTEYPESKYGHEMRQKYDCLGALLYFSISQTWEDCLFAYNEFDTVKCPHEGFEQLAVIVNLFRVAVEDWANLLKQHEITESNDCNDFVDFKTFHPVLDLSECSFVDDSIYSCILRSDFAEALLAGTVDAYRDFIARWPDTDEAEKIQEKVADISAFAEARESGSHAAYMNYLRNYPSGDSADVAWDCLRRIEEPDWRRAKREGTWEALNAFEDKYPFGYYYDAADELKMSILERIQDADINQNSFQLIGLCASPDSSVIIIGNIVHSDARYDITLTSSSTGKKMYRSIHKGEIALLRVPNGNYRLMIEARNTETHYGGIEVMGGMYGQAFYIVHKYGLTGLKNEDISQESIAAVADLASRAIESEAEEFQRREEARMEKRVYKVDAMHE